MDLAFADVVASATDAHRLRPARADRGFPGSGRRERLTGRTLPAIALALALGVLAIAAVLRFRSSAPATPEGELPTADAATLADSGVYPHAHEPIGAVREIYAGTLSPDLAVNTFRNIDRLFPTRTVHHSETPLPLPQSVVPLGPVAFTYGQRGYGLNDYITLNHVTAILVLRDGQVAYERYLAGNSSRTRWMSMSVAKSITSTLIGAAVKQGRLSLSDPVTKFVPALAGSAYDGVAVRDVLTMSSGVRWTEPYADAASDRRRLLDAQISQQSGSAMAVMRSLSRAGAPHTVFNYNTGETQVAGEVLRHAVDMPLAEYLEERIWRRVGMEADANWWLDSPDGVEMGGTGFNATLRDYGRFGQFVLNDGVAAGESILPNGWMREATSPLLLTDGKPLAYGYLWWLGPTQASMRDRAFSAIGIGGQHIYINPAARVVIVIWAAQAGPSTAPQIDDWVFFDAVVEALRRQA